jgi:hypothetical protein
MSDDGGDIQPAVSDERSAGAVWALTVVLLIAVIAGLYFFLQSQNGPVAGDDGMAGATRNGSVTAKDAGNANGDSNRN